METLKLRIRDKHTVKLNRLSSSINFVWNYVNDLSYKHLQKTGKFSSAFDLNKYTKGSGELLGLHSQTIQAINETHAKSRKQFKKAKGLVKNNALIVVGDAKTTQFNSKKGKLAKCGTWHDSDINASRNILAVGLNRLVEAIPSL